MDKENNLDSFVKIKPINRAGLCLSYYLSPNITVEQISEVLGFSPNVKDDPDKVKYSWGFTINGKKCGIWDYKGSRWSVYDPSGHLVKDLFD